MLTSEWNYYFRIRMNLSLQLLGNRLKIPNKLWDIQWGYVSKGLTQSQLYMILGS